MEEVTKLLQCHPCSIRLSVSWIPCYMRVPKKTFCNKSGWISGSFSHVSITASRIRPVFSASSKANVSITSPREVFTIKVSVANRQRNPHPPDGTFYISHSCSAEYERLLYHIPLPVQTNPQIPFPPVRTWRIIQQDPHPQCLRHTLDTASHMSYPNNPQTAFFQSHPLPAFQQ